MGKHRRRGGRPRNVTAIREASGRLKRAPKSALGSLAAASPEAMAQRARLVGADKAHDARAATAYGRLFLAGMLGDRDYADRRYAAAEQVDRVFRTWASMAGTRRADTGAMPRADLDPAAWDRTDALYRAIRDAMPGPLCLSLLDALCLDGIEPPRMIGPFGYHRPGQDGYTALVARLHIGICAALDAAAAVLRLGERRAA